MIRSLSILFLSFFFVSGGVTQEHNINETVGYINETLKENRFYKENRESLEFEVDKSGTLTAQYYWGNYKAFKHIMHLHDLDKSKVKRDTSTLFDDELIEITCKEGKRCIEKQMNHKNMSREKKTYVFQVSTEDNAGVRIKNALVHLIELAEEKYPKRKKEEDPYNY